MTGNERSQSSQDPSAAEDVGTAGTHPDSAPDQLKKAQLWWLTQAEGLASVLGDQPSRPPPPLDPEARLVEGPVVIRRVRTTDASIIHRLFTDTIARRLGRTSASESEREVRDVLDQLSYLNECGLHHTFAIEIVEQDALIGVTELRSFDLINRTAAIGTWIGEQYWGKGLAHHARVALFHYAFRMLGLERIEAGVHADNYRALAALAKLGFKIEGRLRARVRQGEDRLDYLILGLLQSESVQP